MNKIYPSSFKYPDIKPEDRLYGAGLAGEVLREDGDWRNFTGPDEDQARNGVEPSSCYVEAQQAAIATIQEETFNLLDKNYSARFNALKSDGTPTGGDPLKAALSIKKDGLIPQTMMDFTKELLTWEDYHSWKGVDREKCEREGKLFAQQWDVRYKIVAEKDDSLEFKYSSLREALKRSPVSLSVCAWYERGGRYYKPKGARDNHLVEALYVDSENQIYIRDTYAPYRKILEANTDFDFAMYHILTKKTPQEQLDDIKKNFISILINYLAYLLKTTVKLGDEIISGIFSKRIE